MPAISAIRVPGDRRHVFPVTEPTRRPGATRPGVERHARTLQAPAGSPSSASPPAASPCSPPAAPVSTQAADGSSSGGNKTIVFSPLALKIPAMKGLSEGVTHYGDEQGLRGPRAGPQPRPAEAGHRPPERHRVRPRRRRLGDRDRRLLDEGAGRQTAQTGRGPADPQRHARATTASTACSPASPSPPSTTWPRARRIGEELGNCINEKLDGKAEVHHGGERPRHRRQGGDRDRRQGGARRHRARRRDRHQRGRQRPRRGADRHRQRAPGQPRRPGRARPTTTRARSVPSAPSRRPART